MLRRLSSASSFASSFVRPTSTSISTSTSASSAIQDAIDSSILTSDGDVEHHPQPSHGETAPPTPRKDRLSQANEDLITALEQLQIVPRSAYSTRLALVASIHHVLQQEPDVRNSFRDHGGFLSAVSVLASLDESIAASSSAPQQDNDNEQQQEDSRETRAMLRYELASLALQVIDVAIQNSDINRNVFLDTVGFEAVGEAIKLSGLMRDQEGDVPDGQQPPAAEATQEGAPQGGDTPAQPTTKPTPAERILSLLWSFLTSDFSSPPLFTQIRRHLTSVPPASSSKGIPSDQRHAQILTFLAERTSSLPPLDQEIPHNPQVIPLILELELSLQGEEDDSQKLLRFAVVAALKELAGSSRRAQVAVSEAGVGGIALERLWPENRPEGDQGMMDQESKAVWRGLAEILLELGAGTKETRKMFQSVVKGWQKAGSEGNQEELDEDMLALILSGVRNSRYPSFIHFDLSLQGHSALTLRSLGRQFPPPTHGYTFLGWISIDSPPTATDERLIIFGCGDATGKCHVEIAITPELQLSLTTALGKPRIIFPSYTFVPQKGNFHHLALVHQRPKYSSNSPVSLYIDGKLIETLKAPYPVAPPKDWEVQAWLGTPLDRVPPGRAERGRSEMRWDLGPTWLIHGDVPEEMVYVCATLGPRYSCNFQDQLGQFQTNETSTRLNVRLEKEAKEKPKSARNSSPLVYAIRDKGSAVIPEHRIIFAFSALNVLVAGSGRGLSSSGLSSHGQQALSLATRARGKVIVNSAIPLIEDALVHPHGLGHLDGQPCIANPKGLDVAIWKIGGVPVALRLVELARTPHQLTLAVQLFVELVSQSWRNSEDTERVQGYEILALHLRAKSGLVTPEAHDALSEFVGFSFEDPRESVVSNPLAFRFLALDFGLWGLVEPSVQWAHFDRLREFVERSRYKEFNIRRLVKMHITRKLLFALRASYFDDSLTREVVDLLLIIVRAHFNTESVRHLATFLTATLCQVIEKPARINGAPTQPTPATVDPSKSFVLDAEAVDQGSLRAPLRVLKGLHDLLLNPDSENELTKFAKVITSKWALLFVLDKSAHPYAAVLAVRILVRLLQSQGNAYITKFVNSIDGFSILRAGIPHLWQFGQIHLALFSLLHGHDITVVSLDAPFAPGTFALSSTEVSIVSSEVVRIIIAAIGRGVKDLPAEEEPGRTLKDQDDLAKVERPETKTETEGEKPLPAGLPQLVGFEALLDLLAQTSKSVGNTVHLVDSPVPLQDLALAVLPFLRLPGPSEQYSPSSSSIPALPILSSRQGFQVGSPELRPVNPASPSIPTPNGVSGQGLRLQIPSLNGSPVPDALASPMTALEEEGGLEFPIRNVGKLSAAAASVVRFLAQPIASQITSRHVHRHTGSGVDPSSSPLTDPALHLLRQTFAAAAPGRIPDQVAFRSLLLADIFRRLSRASTAPLTATRVASLVSLATDYSFEGWNADLVGLIEFILSYLEKLLDDAVLASPSPHSRSLDNFFRCLNRAVLLALSLEREESTKVLKLLVRHQLSVFATPNTDAEFFRCLVQRLDSMLRTSAGEEETDVVVDFFKLLVLQRPTEVEVSLIQQRKHASETPIIEKLIDTDTPGFVTLLKEHHDQLDSLEVSWEAFVEDEGLRARRAVDAEIARLDVLAKASKAKRDAARRKTRKQRSSIYEWSEGIHEVEATRVAHTRQDIADLSSFIQTEWHDQSKNLQRECGIWGAAADSRKWRLDFTEGHNRIRKKLQAEATKRQRPILTSPIPSSENHSRSLGATRRESYIGQQQLHADGGSSPLPSPVIPQDETMWGENFSQSHEPVIPDLDTSDAYEDKNRKVRRSLEPGDVIKSVFNINRIVGLDACSGLLLLAKKNVYIVDNFFQKANGELVDAWDAPPSERDQHLQTLSELAGRDSKKAAQELDTAHRSRRWSWSDLLEVHERTYLFRKIALELFFADGRSFLLTFAEDQRSRAYSFIAEYAPSAVAFGSLNEAGVTFGAKVTDVVLGQRTKLEGMTKRWERREVSNFEYLMFLNTYAGRTYNDLTNYPVFPWVLADYSSSVLDLDDPKSYRDLSKPMGAQSEDRKKEFVDRYTQLSELDDGTQPFHYGTHYSSAMITVGYLLRLRPFTESYLDLQGGNFDHADRMFWSIPKAWESASKHSRSDVRELIPEFYFLPDFLLNSNNLDLGKRQESGSAIDNVELPPWANNDPRLFVDKHRQALESEHVSQHLGSWIDLIFGHRQTGEAAIESCNIFHHLSYEGAIDLDAIQDNDERRAATSTIHNFGMTPRQLFTKPHPLRVAPLQPKATHALFSPNLPLENRLVTLVQSAMPVFEMQQQVYTIYLVPGAPDKTVATPTQSLFIPDGSYSHLISWGFASQTVRLTARGNTLPTTIFENLHSEFVSAGCFADSKTFVTASTDTTVSLWKWKWRSGGKEGHFQQLDCLRGHSDQVSCVAASRAFSIVVSGSDDRTAIIWDLNRKRFVHQLSGHDMRVHLVAISDTTGDVATCSGSILRIWTVNGKLLATQSTSNYTEAITAVAFSLSETTPIIATGHRNGKVMLWERVPSSERTGFSLKLIHTITYKDRFDPQAQPDITALAFSSRALFVGDAIGKVWLFSPPGGDLFLPDSAGNGACMSCFTKFTLLEARRRCSACSGIFCSLCTTTSLEVGGRFCGQCFSKLSPLMAPK
ncbi:beach-domain-containing protein [Meredithblackwellia eburnea MCA 4105]